MTTPYRALHFKCTSKDARGDAWCLDCSFSFRGTSVASGKHAKRHTEQTGHETRVESTYQRGYETIETRRRKVKP